MGDEVLGVLEIGSHKKGYGAYVASSSLIIQSQQS